MAKKGITAAQFYEDDAGDDAAVAPVQSADAPHHVCGAGSGTPWYREAVMLVAAAKKERSRLQWWKNTPALAAVAAGGQSPIPSTECQNCFVLPN